MATVWINEFHYDNTGIDTGEFVEIAGVAGTDLSGYDLVLYNGSTNIRAPYDTINLSGTLANDTGNGFGFDVINFGTNGIQNGSPDGIALIDAFNTVIQFLSYEGSFIAASGPAAGLTSNNIGVREGTTTPAGHSLQLIGNGSDLSSFGWAGPTASTAGAVNTDQTLIPEIAAVPLPAAMPMLLVGLVALRGLKRKL